jgi:F-type H+-transporting ATPase subunit b
MRLSRSSLLAGGAFWLLPAASALAAETAPGEEGGGLPQLDVSTYAGQIFWLLISFALLYFVFSRVFLPRLGGVIEERRNRIADDYDQAAEFKREAEDAKAAYEQALADAKARAASVAAETKATIDAEIAEAEKESDARLEAEITAAEARIAETAEKARGAVREAAKETTKALVDALIGETPSDASVDQALEQAGDRHARAA